MLWCIYPHRRTVNIIYGSWWTFTTLNKTGKFYWIKLLSIKINNTHDVECGTDWIVIWKKVACFNVRIYTTLTFFNHKIFSTETVLTNSWNDMLCCFYFGRHLDSKEPFSALWRLNFWLSLIKFVTFCELRGPVFEPWFVALQIKYTNRSFYRNKTQKSLRETNLWERKYMKFSHKFVSLRLLGIVGLSWRYEKRQYRKSFSRNIVFIWEWTLAKQSFLLFLLCLQWPKGLIPRM